MDVATRKAQFVSPVSMQVNLNSNLTLRTQYAGTSSLSDFEYEENLPFIVQSVCIHQQFKMAKLNNAIKIPKSKLVGQTL